MIFALLGSFFGWATTRDTATLSTSYASKSRVSSKTAGVTAPLFDGLKLGFGNEAELGAEGYADGNLLATHITGPVLVKNPDFIDLIITRIFAAKDWELPAELPVLPHEREAYEVTLRELSARVKEN